MEVQPDPPNETSPNARLLPYATASVPKPLDPRQRTIKEVTIRSFSPVILHGCNVTSDNFNPPSTQSSAPHKSALVPQTTTGRLFDNGV
jgi:hypothetical protein